MSAPSLVHDVLREEGRPLEPTIRRSMESRFRHDFSSVRIHAGAGAAESAHSLDADAYTVGRDIVFGRGRYAPRESDGEALLTHELAHVVQQRAYASDPVPPRLPIGARGDAREREADRVAAFGASPASVRSAPPGIRLQRQPTGQGQPAAQNVCLTRGATARGGGGTDCVVLRPENCATYELWVQTFAGMRSFTADDTVAGGTPTGQTVLGGGAADLGPSAGPDVAPAPAINPRLSDRFIDRPTDQWVRGCLPANLRETAYRLPSDCADIAVILRHVWLAAHGRTETYDGGRAANGQRRTWVVGDRAGGAARQRVGRVISQVGTVNLARTVAAYTNGAGQPLRSLAELQNMLHPGDILVWEHHSGGSATRTGGHAHTIQSIERTNGRITRLSMLQGNLPIMAPQAAAIRQQTGTSNPNPGGADPLRREPGRRIERATLTPGVDIADSNGILTWHGSTLLVVAGPPRSAQRPRARGAQRGVGDWLPAVRNASRDRLHGIFEAALLEARATVEGGRVFSDADAQALGEAAGNRLWTLARARVRRRQDFGERSHFDPLHRLRSMIRALGGIAPPVPARERTPNARTVRARFETLDRAFHLASRGISSVGLDRRPIRGSRSLKFLVTGFDPFTGGNRPPQPGTWNPSGAVALAMDGRTIPVQHGARAAVEGAVMPVSFREFRGDIVETLVARARTQNVDAIITTSQDSGIGPTGSVRIEQFAVGVHDVRPLQTHRLVAPERPSGAGLRAIPASTGGSTGAPILSSTVDATTLAQGLGTSGTLPRAVAGTDITFRFADAPTATAALRGLGLRTQASTNVSRFITIDDVAVLRRIANNSQPIRGSRGVRFRVGQQSFDADIIRGPGGSFLSNEISYRTLRAIGGGTQAGGVESFHLHVPGGPRITGGGAAERTARGAARRILDRLVNTVKRIIVALGKQILAAAGPSTP